MSFCDLFTQITLSSFYVLGNRLPVHEKIKSNSQKKPNYYLSRGLGSFAPFSNASETQQFSLPHNSPCLKILHLLPYGFPRQMCEVHKLRGPNLGLDESWCVEGLKQQELQPGGAVDVFLPEDTGFTGFVLQSLSPSKPGRIALALAFLWAASSVQCLTHDHTICH